MRRFRVQQIDANILNVTFNTFLLFHKVVEVSVGTEAAPYIVSGSLEAMKDWLRGEMLPGGCVVQVITFLPFSHKVVQISIRSKPSPYLVV